jgi:hypothetical protein
MNGRVLDPQTGAVIGEGAVQLTDDGREGSICCLLKSEVWSGSRRDSVILELESGERLEVVIIGASGPYALRHDDETEEIGSAVTSFRVQPR